MEVHGSDRQAARRDALSALKERHDALVEWLEREAADCVAEQRHLEEGTVERIYWHYGYLMALRDVLAMFPTASTSRH